MRGLGVGKGFTAMSKGNLTGVAPMVGGREVEDMLPPQIGDLAGVSMGREPCM